ncbi:heterodisulfide reductase, iron-sulfur binding subunit, putative [Candidatus Syntrophocurvum alkaliphilum]|uniref:Heterodisulfide reductase, iron-sulfur binding subunit, putative n=1 Tax=Candidatus Syntrophocurvum alkaliphilum TaxID=2293317 RepID=A0A6I6DCJ9_9FIRM|nr:4Fe-4S dicluster domain-containing protein [Candidatus Syntrophocurvum alkaliphilum]QGT98860.1 heterodisulfide reductase, iron-sulfur binding subunit, putative [Candidatus Syntrophocurvum alkaliphilum]
MKVLNKSKLDNVFEKLSKDTDLYLPMQKGRQTGYFSYKTLNDDTDDIVLDILNVYLPPKNIVLPQTERMYSFKTEGTEVNINEVYEVREPKVIFGIRSCDVKSIEYLDEVFFTKGYTDNYYKARREETVIIANACYFPGKSCFCESMGVDPLKPDTADVIIHDTGQDGYVWEAKTEKGEEVTKSISEFLEDKNVELPKPTPLKRSVNYDGVAEKLKDMFDHPMWEKLSDPCQTCGICTYICPTCYCFDIQVKSWGEEGYRFRCWDSCMYGEYSMMAGGHNPREAAKERFRNRFLHKLQFYKERYGSSLCTGCGRCVVACPTGVSIIKIIDEVKEANAGE